MTAVVMTRGSQLHHTPQVGSAQIEPRTSVSPVNKTPISADATAIAIRIPEGWLVGDPGTGTYNGDESTRNYFRSSAAHNVLRIDGLDQLEPHRAFRWKHRAAGGIVDPIAFDGGVVMAAWYDAYQRLDTATTVIRVLISSEDIYIVADFVSAPAQGRLAVTFGPDVDLEGDLARLGGRDFAFDLAKRYTPIDDGIAGRWSSTYGTTQSTMRVEVETPARSPIAWSLSTRLIEYTADDQMIGFEHGRASVLWSSGGAELRVELNDGRRETRRIFW